MWALLWSCLQPVALRAQVLDQTHVVEAYNCSCSESGRPINSIQLGVRLDKSTTVYTALSTLVGCGRIMLNVDGERFPVRITLANARDNIAKLEPVEMAMEITRFEQKLKLKRTPDYKAVVPGMERDLQPFIVILQGARMTKQKRGLTDQRLAALDRGNVLRYGFTMGQRKESDVDFDRLLGGPVWLEKGKEHLAGLISGIAKSGERTEFVVTGVENILDKGQFVPYQLYLNHYRDEQGDCGPKQIYWDGFGTYRYRTGEEPTYARISRKDDWKKTLRAALLRIREHMRDSIPTKGTNREGDPSLCVFVNDLENVYFAFAEQATQVERDNWPVLPRFVKAYSNVFCKNRKFTDTEFTRDILELNFWMDRIGSDELRLLYTLGYDWNAFEGFVKRYFILTQISNIRKRYDGLMARARDISDPCQQLPMLEELEQVLDDWVRHGGPGSDQNQVQLAQYRRTLAAKRDSVIKARMEEIAKDTTEFAALRAAIEQDSCLTEAEVRLLLKKAENRMAVKEKEDLAYGHGVVDGVRATIAGALGQQALSNVVTKVFRVEGGIGIELTIRGGGAVLDRRLVGNAGDASDTTTVYRSGFPLGSVGDTLSADIAQVFWERMCEDYSSRKWAYRTEMVDVTGMADGVPVRSRITFAEGCRQQLSARKIEDPNQQLAFARAWSLVEQIKAGDRCGLFDLLQPVIHYRAFPQRGGDYQGVSMRAVIKRL